MSQQLQLKLKKTGVLILAWLGVGLFITIYDYLAHSYDICDAMNVPAYFINALRYNLIGAFIGSLMASFVLIFIVDEKFRDKPYGYGALIILLSFILAFWIVTFFMGVIMISGQSEVLLNNEEIKDRIWQFMQHPVHFKNMLIWSFVTMFTQLLLQFNNKFGEGLLWSIITGRFQTPKQMERIFMLVDINSSTTIAEKLGDEQYHMLLREFFADITEPILRNKGHIYQYVGDEVIIAWKRKDGIENNHCIRCFFDMKKKIELLENKYRKEYGIVPSFKAGLHWGKVTVGEVGILKRELTYSGDILNTASRIQQKCREFNVDFIASGDIVKELSITNHYITRFLGYIKLRGKNAAVELRYIAAA